MAKKPKDENPTGAAVRKAYDGPKFDDHDKFIGFCEARNREDRDRSSSAAESRQKIGAFLDETELNPKAVSWGRQILKINDRDNGQAKAMDVIRSLEVLLPMVKAHVAGQGTGELALEEEATPPPKAKAGAAKKDDDLPAWDTPADKLAAE